MNKEIEPPIETSVSRCKNCGAPLEEVGSLAQQNDDQVASVICNKCGYIQTITALA